jgi:hypothetical protein
MKTKIPHLFLVLGIYAAQSASAADVLLSFSSFDADGGQPSYQLDGSNSGSATLVSSFGDPTTYSFTLVNDLDGGGVDDTLTFDFVYTIYTGSTISGGDVTLGTTQTIASPGNAHFGQYPTGDPNTNAMLPGDSFRLSIQNISYTDGEGDSNIARFLGFERFTKFGGSSDGQDLLLGTTSYTTLDVGTSTSSVVDFGGYVADDLVLTTNITSGSANQRFRDLHFDFEVVPEPSSTALLGLGGLALMLRRKRS